MTMTKRTKRTRMKDRETHFEDEEEAVGYAMVVVELIGVGEFGELN